MAQFTYKTECQYCGQTVNVSRCLLCGETIVRRDQSASVGRLGRHLFKDHKAEEIEDITNKESPLRFVQNEVQCPECGETSYSVYCRECLSSFDGRTFATAKRKFERHNHNEKRTIKQ